MALFIEAQLVAILDDAVIYAYQVGPDDPSQGVVIPFNDMESLMPSDSSYEMFAAKVMVKAVKLRELSGGWPDYITIAS